MKHNLERTIDKYLGIFFSLILVFLKFIFEKKNYSLTGVTRILVIKLAMMGDTVLLYPSIKAMREKYSNAEINVLCSPVNVGIVKKWRFINNFYEMDFKNIIRNPLKLIAIIA